MGWLSVCLAVGAVFYVILPTKVARRERHTATSLALTCSLSSAQAYLEFDDDQDAGGVGEPPEKVAVRVDNNANSKSASASNSNSMGESALSWAGDKHGHRGDLSEELLQEHNAMTNAEGRNTITSLTNFGSGGGGGGGGGKKSAGEFGSGKWSQRSTGSNSGALTGTLRARSRSRGSNSRGSDTDNRGNGGLDESTADLLRRGDLFEASSAEGGGSTLLGLFARTDSVLLFAFMCFYELKSNVFLVTFADMITDLLGDGGNSTGTGGGGSSYGSYGAIAGAGAGAGAGVVYGRGHYGTDRPGAPFKMAAAGYGYGGGGGGGGYGNHGNATSGAGWGDADGGGDSSFEELAINFLYVIFPIMGLVMSPVSR
jgi:hypothetical protein